MFRAEGYSWRPSATGESQHKSLGWQTASLSSLNGRIGGCGVLEMEFAFAGGARHRAAPFDANDAPPVHRRFIVGLHLAIGDVNVDLVVRNRA